MINGIRKENNVDMMGSIGNREIKPATSKLIDYLKYLEYRLGYKVYEHKNMPLWRAANRISKLKAKLDEQQQTN